MSSNTDISKNRFISLFHPKIQSWIILLRLDRPIGWWLLVLPSWWTILIYSNDLLVSFKLILLFTLGSILMRGAGCIINDYWDIDIDKKVSRTATRPLANNEISIFEAFVGLFIVLFLSLLILIQLSFLAWIVGLISIPLIIVYPLAKRFSRFPQFYLGIVFSWGVPLGWASTNQNFSIELIFLYIGTVAWVFGYDSIYSIQDKFDDKKIAVYSTAITFDKNLKLAISISYLIAISLWSFVSNSFFWYLGIIFLAAHMTWQIIKLDINKPATALRLFKSNRDMGLIFSASCLIDNFFI